MARPDANNRSLGSNRTMTTRSTASSGTAPPTLEPTRDRILAVATRMFAQEGYDAVGMRAIADAAGIRIASLYNHFPSKARILYAILSVVMRSFVDSHTALLDGGESRSERLV